MDAEQIVRLLKHKLSVEEAEVERHKGRAEAIQEMLSAIETATRLEDRDGRA